MVAVGKVAGFAEMRGLLQQDPGKPEVVRFDGGARGAAHLRFDVGKDAKRGFNLRRGGGLVFLVGHPAKRSLRGEVVGVVAVHAVAAVFARLDLVALDGRAKDEAIGIAVVGVRRISAQDPRLVFLGALFANATAVFSEEDAGVVGEKLEDFSEVLGGFYAHLTHWCWLGERFCDLGFFNVNGLKFRVVDNFKDSRSCRERPKRKGDKRGKRKGDEDGAGGGHRSEGLGVGLGAAEGGKIPGNVAKVVL